MQFLEFELIKSIAAGAGGGGVVLCLINFLANKYIERVKNQLQKELENYKTGLRKSEFLFHKEFEAKSQLFAVIDRITPKYSVRDMDWDEACEDLAGRLGEIEKLLEKYLSRYSAALDPDTRNSLSQVKEWASQGKFASEIGGPEELDVETANQILDELIQLEQFVHYSIWGQESR